MRKRIVLVDRDKQLLTRIFENRVMSATQIGSEFFPNVSSQNVLRRLAKLSRYGYLRRQMASSINLGDVSVFSTTPKALEVIRQRYPFRIEKEYCKSDSVEHDLELVILRNRLQLIQSVTGYYTENMLQACEDFDNAELFAPFKNQNTDVVMEINKSGKISIVGLEFERSEKNFDRYAEKIRSYYSDPRTATIFYVCRSSKIQRAVARAELSVMKSRPPRCFYGLWENVLRVDQKCTFTNLKGYTITID